MHDYGGSGLFVLQTSERSVSPLAAAGESRETRPHPRASRPFLGRLGSGTTISPHQQPGPSEPATHSPVSLPHFVVPAECTAGSNFPFSSYALFSPCRCTAVPLVHRLSSTFSPFSFRFSSSSFFCVSNIFYDFSAYLPSSSLLSRI